MKNKTFLTTTYWNKLLINFVADCMHGTIHLRKKTKKHWLKPNSFCSTIKLTVSHFNPILNSFWIRNYLNYRRLREVSESVFQNSYLFHYFLYLFQISCQFQDLLISSSIFHSSSSYVCLCWLLTVYFVSTNFIHVFKIFFFRVGDGFLFI